MQSKINKAKTKVTIELDEQEASKLCSLYDNTLDFRCSDESYVTSIENKLFYELIKNIINIVK